jgi:hypothetical protein
MHLPRRRWKKYSSAQHCCTSRRPFLQSVVRLSRRSRACSSARARVRCRPMVRLSFAGRVHRPRHPRDGACFSTVTIKISGASIFGCKKIIYFQMFRKRGNSHKKEDQAFKHHGLVPRRAGTNVHSQEYGHPCCHRQFRS